MYSVTILSSIHPWKWYLISSHNFGLISYSPFYWDVFLFHIFVDIFLLFFLDCFVFQQCSPGPKKSIVLTKIHSKFAKQFIDSRTSISVPVILCFLFKNFKYFLTDYFFWSDCFVFLLRRCLQPSLPSSPAAFKGREVGDIFFIVKIFIFIIVKIFIIFIIVKIFIVVRWDLSSTIPCNVDEVKSPS